MERAPRIYVGGVPKQANNEDFEEYFKQFGAVKEITLMGGKSGGEHRGFGFIQYEEKDVADQVLGQKHQLKGLSMGVKLAIRKETRLFLGGLKDAVTEPALQEHFEKECEVAKLNMFKERGFGFITIYGSQRRAEEIINKRHEINGVTIRVSIAQPKDESGSGGKRGRGRGGYDGGYGGRGRGYGYSPYGPPSHYSPYGMGRGGYGGPPRGGYGGYGGGYGAPSSYQDSRISSGGYGNSGGYGGAYGGGNSSYAYGSQQGGSSDPYGSQQQSGGAYDQSSSAPSSYGQASPPSYNYAQSSQQSSAPGQYDYSQSNSGASSGSTDQYVSAATSTDQHYKPW